MLISLPVCKCDDNTNSLTIKGIPMNSNPKKQGIINTIPLPLLIPYLQISDGNLHIFPNPTALAPTLANRKNDDDDDRLLLLLEVDVDVDIDVVGGDGEGDSDINGSTATAGVTADMIQDRNRIRIRINCLLLLAG